MALQKTWTFKSSSNPNKAYEAQLHDDGHISCGCPGWCKRTASDGSRSCKHTRWVEQGVADTYADGVTNFTGSNQPAQIAPARKAPTQTAQPVEASTTKAFTRPKRKINWRD